MTAITDETPLARARRRDADRRRQRVRQALADMHADGSEITVSAEDEGLIRFSILREAAALVSARGGAP